MALSTSTTHAFYPAVDPVLYPTPDGRRADYPATAPDGRLWLPPTAPAMRVDETTGPRYERACLECRRLLPNLRMATGWLCKDCARDEAASAKDPFGLASFWLWGTVLAETPFAKPEPVEVWYRRYGWDATMIGKPVAPFPYFVEQSHALDGLLRLGVTFGPEPDHIAGRTYRWEEREADEARAAGLVPQGGWTTERMDT